MLIKSLDMNDKSFRCESEVTNMVEHLLATLPSFFFFFKLKLLNPHYNPVK